MSSLCPIHLTILPLSIHSATYSSVIFDAIDIWSFTTDSIVVLVRVKQCVGVYGRSPSCIGTVVPGTFAVLASLTSTVMGEASSSSTDISDQLSMDCVPSCESFSKSLSLLGVPLKGHHRRIQAHVIIAEIWLCCHKAVKDFLCLTKLALVACRHHSFPRGSQRVLCSLAYPGLVKARLPDSA